MLTCCKPTLTAYDFMRNLCASLAIKGKTTIPLDLVVEKIYDYRIKHNEFVDLFYDIEFRKGLNEVVSNDIMESIGELQTFGIVGKENPKYVNMIIRLSKEAAQAIMKSCPKTTAQAINQIAETF